MKKKGHDSRLAFTTGELLCGIWEAEVKRQLYYFTLWRSVQGAGAGGSSYTLSLTITGQHRRQVLPLPPIVFPQCPRLFSLRAAHLGQWQKALASPPPTPPQETHSTKGWSQRQKQVSIHPHRSQIALVLIRVHLAFLMVWLTYLQ